MNLPRLSAAVFSVVALAGAEPAWSASGRIDSFSASAQAVSAGTTVDFVATYSISTDQWITGGSNSVEPAPEEGYQEWIQNWYDQHSETLRSVSLRAGDQSFTEFPSVPTGAGHTGSWAFSLLLSGRRHLQHQPRRQLGGRCRGGFRAGDRNTELLQPGYRRRCVAVVRQLERQLPAVHRQLHLG